MQLATLHALLVMAIIAYRLCAVATRNPAAPPGGSAVHPGLQGHEERVAQGPYADQPVSAGRAVPAGPAAPGPGGLYFSPYATYYKPQKYLRQALTPHTQGLIEKLGPDAQAARAVYLRQGLRRFVVNLSPNTDDPMLSMVQEAYGALFAPENVARYFRARRVAQDIWLLTLDGSGADGSDADGSRPDAAVLTAYARRRNFDIASPRNILYRPLVKTGELMPELRLPRVDKAAAGGWPSAGCSQTPRRRV